MRYFKGHYEFGEDDKADKIWEQEFATIQYFINDKLEKEKQLEEFRINNLMEKANE